MPIHLVQVDFRFSAPPNKLNGGRRVGTRKGTPTTRPRKVGRRAVKCLLSAPAGGTKRDGELVSRPVQACPGAHVGRPRWKQAVKPSTMLGWLKWPARALASISARRRAASP